MLYPDRAKYTSTEIKYEGNSDIKPDLDLVDEMYNNDESAKKKECIKCKLMENRQMTKKSVFETLSNIEINPDNIKLKGKYNYISWAAAWQDVSQKYPDATFAKRLSEVNGFVEVDVTIEG